MLASDVSRTLRIGPKAKPCQSTRVLSGNLPLNHYLQDHFEDATSMGAIPATGQIAPEPAGCEATAGPGGPTSQLPGGGARRRNSRPRRPLVLSRGVQLVPLLDIFRASTVSRRVFL